jgi:hypothetical protein
MENQAKLMRESIDEARKSSEKQLRAYVQVSDSNRVTIVMRQDYTHHCEVVIKNSGQTPAYEVMAVGEFQNRPNPQNFTVTLINPSEYQGGKRVLNPQEETILKCKYNSETEYPPDTQTTGRAVTFYIWGRIEYRDAFNNERFTNFCFKLPTAGHIPINEPPRHTYFLVRTEKGNEAN